VEHNNRSAVLAVIFSSLSFGCLGICVRYFLNDCSLGPISVVFIRLTFSAAGLFIVLLIVGRDMLKIRLKDIPFMVFFGIFKILADGMFFFAQDNMSLCLATLLQMTSPYFVMFFSLILFKEKITMAKMLAVGVGTIGCVLVTDVLFGELNVNVIGLTAAVLSGLCFSMFFIGNKMANDKGFRPATILFYTTLAADLMAIPFADLSGTAQALSTVNGWAAALALGIFMTLIPYFLLTWSSSRMDPTVISIISVLEVVGASVVGYFLFNEILDVPHFIGIALVVASIVLINVQLRKIYFKKYGKFIDPVIKLATWPLHKLMDDQMKVFEDKKN